MNRRYVGMLVAMLILSGCGSAPGQPAAPTGHNPSATAAATVQPPTGSTGPAASGAAGSYEAFRAHVIGSVSSLRDMLSSLGGAASMNDTSAVANDAASLQAWGVTEAGWLAANPLDSCYGAAFTTWETVRDHALKAAAGALAGAFDQMEANFASSQAVKVVELLDVTHC